MEDWVWWALSIYPVYVLPGALGRAGLVRRLWCGEASCMGAHSWLGANACVLDKILLNIKLVLRFFLSTLLEGEMFFWLLKKCKGTSWRQGKSGASKQDIVAPVFRYQMSNRNSFPSICLSSCRVAESRPTNFHNLCSK